jgi:hypothetical protein
MVEVASLYLSIGFRCSAAAGCLNRARRRTRARPRNRRRFKSIEDEHEDEPNVDLNQHPVTLV